MKRTVKFTDAEGNRALITVEVQSERNGYKEFSACGDYNGSSGQCRDSIKPKNEAQREFLSVCEKWHLNGTHAGTEEQENRIDAEEKKTGKKLGYDGAVIFLKRIKKYTVTHEGKPYKYGSSWLKRELPANIEEDINRLMDEVEEQEKESKVKDRQLEEAYKNHPSIVFNVFLNAFDNDEDSAKIALAVGLNDGLTVREALEIEVNGNNVTCQGIDYQAGNDEALDVVWDEYLDNYIDDCLLCEIKDETLKRYFDREAWKADAKHDGRGHCLNGYDGGEDSQTVEGEEIYIYRR